ncbi:ABC transporter ATP-binding protein [Variovorax sp. CCNWLW225]|jgi:branched-chain amino acid transport system ATP-binding protein|uniref:ABC transporter ATP-binding protein n=1 Tax=Variovorax sp. CCNWLW225 TaxID=3127462 RepID=UPI0030786037
MRSDDKAALLEIDKVCVQFGAVRAVSDVSLRIPAGGRHALLGTNGAGKSTLFNAICGTVPVSAGDVRFQGIRLAHLAVHARARLGIGRTFQTSLCFGDRSVADNLRVALAGRAGPRFGLNAWPTYGAIGERLENVLERFALKPVSELPVGSLSYGQQREVEIAMALAAEPTLLLLDEPAAGMSPSGRVELLGRLRALPRSVTLLFVEHDMDVALALADEVTVMRDGQVVASGTPEQIRSNELVREMYLGAEH